MLLSHPLPTSMISSATSFSQTSCGSMGTPKGSASSRSCNGSVDEYGLNLTLSQLATFLKYLRATNEKADTHPFRKKAGFFRSEPRSCEKFGSTSGWTSRSNASHSPT